MSAAGVRVSEIVFPHWYKPEPNESNRTRFLGPAGEPARPGANANSIHQVKNVRRALDVMLAAAPAELQQTEQRRSRLQRPYPDARVHRRFRKPVKPTEDHRVVRRGLNEQAIRGRQNWLKIQLRMTL